MSLVDIMTTINNHFVTNYSETPVAYDNVPFESDGKTEYVTLCVVPNVQKQITLGETNNLYRQFGSVESDIYFEKDKGLKRGFELAELVGNTFNSLNINGIQFRTHNLSDMGLSENGFYRMNIYIGFYYDSFV